MPARPKLWRLAAWLAVAGVLALLLAWRWRGWGPPTDLYIRVFKHEAVLEVWIRRGERPYRLYKSYPLTAASGVLGPKRQEGDLQVPEGFYMVDRFNPQSRFHLSLGLNYPNAADRVFADWEQPGSDIFIHGGAVSVGCMPIGDAAIEEVYRIAEQVAKDGHSIAVHIFPARMSGPEWERLSSEHPELARFWSELQPAYAAFETSHQVPRIEVGPDGRYSVR